MNLKVFVDKDQISLNKRVKFFQSNSNINVMNVRYDVNYATKERRAEILYVETKTVQK